MIVRISRSTKMPTLFSAYVSSFGMETLSELTEAKPFSFYHKSLKEYECTLDVLSRLPDPITQTIDDREQLQQPGFNRLHKEKYGYQEDAVDFSKTHLNVFLNFSQGMGKSLTTMKILKENHLAKNLIICGQGNLQEEWLKDAKKHGYDELLNFRIVGGDTGAPTPKKIDWLLQSKDVEVRTDLINIEALRNEQIVAALNNVGYDAIVVDEVQSAKGWKSQQTEGLHELIRPRHQVRIALSGTPVLNNPLEYFSLLKYFGLLKDTARTTFEQYYGKWGFDRWGHYVCQGYRNLTELCELLRPCLCYAPKSELGLLPKTRKRVLVSSFQPGSPQEERFKYLDKMSRAKISVLKKNGFTSKSQIRAEMQFLSSTLQSKIDFAASFKDKKVLVFSQYTEVLDVYNTKLTEMGKRVLYYHGKLSMKERLDVLEKWHKGEADILLLSLMTARYGLNLTEAPEVVFVEPPTSLAILEQGEDRSWRIGQTQPVNSYLLSGTAFDEEDLENIARKQEALDEIAQIFENEFRTI